MRFYIAIRQKHVSVVAPLKTSELIQLIPWWAMCEILTYGYRVQELLIRSTYIIQALLENSINIVGVVEIFCLSGEDTGAISTGGFHYEPM